MAISAVVLAVVDISHIDVVESGRSRDLVGLEQRFVRRRRSFAHAEIGMKSREVHGNAVPNMIKNPAAHASDFVIRVIGARNNQVGDLDPNVRFLVQPFERIKYGLKM